MEKVKFLDYSKAVDYMINHREHCWEMNVEMIDETTKLYVLTPTK